MKLLLILSLPFLLFGFELNFTKEFSKSLLPNELSSTIKVVVENKNEKEVISSLNKYNEFLVKYDKIGKSDISMSITPKYSYKDGQYLFMGYKGTLNYTIFSKESSKIKEFLEEFYSLKKEITTSFFIPTMRWIIDKKIYEDQLEQLRIGAIIWAKNYSKTLSIKLNQICSLQKINISENFARPMSFNSGAKILKTSNKVGIPVIEKVKEYISIQPNIILECK